MNIHLLLFWLPLLLTGCSNSADFWGFSNSFQVSELGMGDITAQTPMTESAISDGLKSTYHLRYGMATHNGQPIALYQGMKAGQVKLEVFGQPEGKVARIDVMDKDVTTLWGAKLGTPFNKLYQRAFSACVKSTAASGDLVECIAPESKHVSYQFTGTWHGPDGLMPSDEVLQHWTVSKIIWRANVS